MKADNNCDKTQSVTKRFFYLTNPRGRGRTKGGKKSKINISHVFRHNLFYYSYSDRFYPCSPYCFVKEAYVMQTAEADDSYPADDVFRRRGGDDFSHVIPEVWANITQYRSLLCLVPVWGADRFHGLVSFSLCGETVKCVGMC
ncbi:hypothetical protein TNIN_451961 [Trichonephila inaurata madagascariensis]|uniref:Uncharacterized protein n=1 Tax=Trichonephila inaurata madagascariensis TaxID=2747483 RepID=A0A8X6YB73_9ARAC|nr:hypothetical protein TNIN_451961 [Trichonephila inaurata madagascariensis]